MFCRKIVDADYADDLALLANTLVQAESLRQLLEQAGGIGLHVNANKTEYICFKQEVAIFTLRGKPLKLVNQFTYLGSNISSTESDANIRPKKAWNAIGRLSIIWNFYLTDKIK